MIFDEERKLFFDWRVCLRCGRDFRTIDSDDPSGARCSPCRKQYGKDCRDMADGIYHDANGPGFRAPAPTNENAAHYGGASKAER